MRISIAAGRIPQQLYQLIQSLQNHDIIWMVHNGQDAVRRCTEDPPDLLIMDVKLSGVDGVEATRRIMKDSPCAILLLANNLNTSAGKVFEAMGAGALDVINMGSEALDEARLKEVFLKKIKTVERLHNTGGVTGRRGAAGRLADTRSLPPLMIIGSSTGGPKALGEILSALPAGFGAAVVIIQHVDQEFSAGLVEWLDSMTSLPVHMAATGTRPQSGHIYVAGTNDHLVLSPACTFTYTSEPRATPYRPSVDAFFRSAARYWPRQEVAALLTGMGRDGAEGLALLKQAGWHTIAQDEASSIVYGMPKAAAELGAAVEILPLHKVSAVMIRRFS